MSKRIALTGGPGGGKTALVEELARDPVWRGCFLVLPQAIFVAGRVGILPREQLFQRLMVETQRGLEQVSYRTLGVSDSRFVLCHRGTLDPLAYWLDRGWSEDAFFRFTKRSREDHFQRYVAVIHLVTAADGALPYYKRWPDAHRPETPAHAIHLDRLLEQVWSSHSNCFYVDNRARDWEAKSKEARRILSSVLSKPDRVLDSSLQ